MASKKLVISFNRIALVLLTTHLLTCWLAQAAAKVPGRTSLAHEPGRGSCAAGAPKAQGRAKGRQNKNKNKTLGASGMSGPCLSVGQQPKTPRHRDTASGAVGARGAVDQQPSSAGAVFASNLPERRMSHRTAARGGKKCV
jgi:hypothetical protein